MQAEDLLDILARSGEISDERRKELQELIIKEKSINSVEVANGESENIESERLSSPSTYSIVQQKEKHKMYYGVCRDDHISASEKKRPKSKEFKEGRRREANAPSLDRIPLPSLSEPMKQEYRAITRDTQQKKYRISKENPPSVCLYTILNAQNSLCSGSISDDGSIYALGFDNSVIQVNTLSADHIKSLKKPDELEQLDNDEMDSFVDEMYDPQNRPKSVDLVGHSGPIYSLSFSCEKRLLLSGSRDSTIRLWNLEMSRNLVVYRSMAPVWQVQFCSRGYYFAASTADQTVSLWTTDRLKPLRIFTDAKDDICCLDFHPNCNYISGGGDDNIIRVWDVLTGTCVRTFAGHKGPIRGLKTSHCGRYLISNSEDGSMAVWDLGQQKMIAVYEVEGFEHNSPIVFSRDGSVVATGIHHGVGFFSMDALLSDQTPQPIVNSQNFHLFSYPTKKTSILDFHFTRKNVVVALGLFEK